MSVSGPRHSVIPVGIDLGTTYSSLSYLTAQGQPVTLPNDEGELATPSVVFFDGREVIVGTEALRHSISMPDRVVQHAKRFMGDPHKCWVFEGRVYRPKDIASFIVKKLLHAAEEQLGRIRHAVITVPAQFSDLQRQETIDAGLQAGLERVDIINEPVAASLCYVLGEGMWFAELANDQTVMVFDLGGGTLDLSLVRYNQQEVRVIASGGDLKLGGLDWNRALQEHVCDLFVREAISDPRQDAESMQALLLEVEQAKRSLSVRSRSAVLIQHAGRRKSFPVDRQDFEEMTKSLLDRTEALTRGLLKQNKLGWAHIDAVLATGGASRMPMIRNMLQRISGTTLNQSLSPDQSISHGAAYYAGMLLSGRRLEKVQLNSQVSERLATFRQQSVSGRSLGILVKNTATQARVPHALIPANTPLPCAYRQTFGTVTQNQKQVRLSIIESGASETDAPVELGECVIAGLPEKLPVKSPIEVTFQYDEQGRLHVEAVEMTSGRRAETAIERTPPPVQATPNLPVPKSPAPQLKVTNRPKQAHFRPATPTSRVPAPSVSVEDSQVPIPLCEHCGNVLPSNGFCSSCKRSADPKSPIRRVPTSLRQKSTGRVGKKTLDQTEPLHPPSSPPGPPS